MHPLCDIWGHAPTTNRKCHSPPARAVRQEPSTLHGKICLSVMWHQRARPHGKAQRQLIIALLSFSQDSSMLYEEFAYLFCGDREHARIAKCKPSLSLPCWVFLGPIFCSMKSLAMALVVAISNIERIVKLYSNAINQFIFYSFHESWSILIMLKHVCVKDYAELFEFSMRPTISP